MIKYFTRRFDNFIEQRLEVADSVVTHHKRTYVLPNRFGYLLLVIILLMQRQLDLIGWGTASLAIILRCSTPRWYGAVPFV